MPRARTRPDWTHDQLLVVFNLYCRTMFGRLHSKNPDVKRLASAIGRTPSAVAMKACNFASLDPVLQARGIRGLRKASNADRALWAEFTENSESIAAESQTAWERLFPPETSDGDVEPAAAGRAQFPPLARGGQGGRSRQSRLPNPPQPPHQSGGSRHPARHRPSHQTLHSLLSTPPLASPPAPPNPNASPAPAACKPSSATPSSSATARAAP